MYPIFKYFLLIFLLLFNILTWALPTARTQGPFEASDSKATPYLQLGDLLAHFQIFLLNTTNISNIQQQIDRYRVSLDFSQFPDQNSHSVGENWYRFALPTNKSVVLSWTYAKNHRSLWFAARSVRGKLQIASDQTQVWQAVTPLRSRYENWTVKGEIKVEIEVLNLGNDSQSILYRFRLLSDQTMQVSAPQQK